MCKNEGANGELVITEPVCIWNFLILGQMSDSECVEDKPILATSLGAKPEHVSEF